MCLGVPGKITEMYQNGDLPMGKVDFGAGVMREVCLAYVPKANVGDYVIIHVGFALNLLNEKEAMETLEALRQVGSFEEELMGSAAEIEPARDAASGPVE